MNTDLQIHEPLNNLIDKHAYEKEQLSVITSMLNNNPELKDVIISAIRYDSGSYVSDNFDIDCINKVLDAKYWKLAFALGNFTDLMPAKDRDDWHETIRELKTPEFKKETVEATIENLILNSREMFARKVEGVFNSLSREHVTNVPEGFGTKIIMYVDGIGSSASSKIYDLFSVIGQCYGVGTKYASHAYSFIASVPTDGQWRWAAGNICEVKCYKKGTMHIRLHDDVKHKLNNELHYLYPYAIPESSRKRTKQSKTHLPKLYDELIQDKTLDALKSSKIIYRTGCYELEDYGYDKRVDEIYKCLGGIKSSYKTVRGYRNNERQIAVWRFDYDPSELLQDIRVLRRIPDKQAYQFYPTPDDLVQKMVDMADINNGQSILEPSAGSGNILDALKNLDANITAVEISKLRASVLKERYADINVHHDDFLSWINPHGYDRIIMNPPFTKGQAFMHVQRAVTMLNPNGKLIAVVPSGFKGDISIDYTLSDAIDNAFSDASVSVRILEAVK